MDRGLLLLLLLLVVAIGNCLTFDSRLSGSKNSRRNHKYPHLNGEEAVLSAAAAVAVAATADYHPDYLPQESIHHVTTSNNNREDDGEYRGGKLIGKWRSTGEAIEPKWRDGDSVPLVPFEEAATRRKVPKPREKVNSFSGSNFNYSDNLREPVKNTQEKKPLINFPLVITDKPVNVNSPINSPGIGINGGQYYQNGGIPSPIIFKSPQSPVAVPVPLNHEPITNKLHELHLAKLRYLNIPLTNINLPIPEIISSSEITPHNNYYTTDENINNNNNNNNNNYSNNNSLRNGSKRYRTRKPKPVTQIPEEDSHTSYMQQTIQTSLSTTPITTPTLSVTTYTTPITTTITSTSTSLSTTTTSKPTTVSTSSSSSPSISTSTGTLTPTEKTKQVTASTRNSDWVNPFGNKNEYELNDEEYQRPRPRKRRPPTNYEFQVDRNRESDGAGQRKRNRTKEENPNQEENSELKSLLKMQQVEGSSLSEVLQRKNLSLSDLLKRKSEVINALKSKDDEVDSGFNNITSLFNNTNIGGNESNDGNKNNEDNENERRSKNNSVNNEDNNINKKIKNSIKETNERRWRRPFRRNKLRVPSRTTSTTTTPRSSSSKEEITDELDKKKLTESNERKYNEKLSTVSKLTSPIIFPRLNTFTKKPVSVITTSTSTISAITTKAPVIKEVVPVEETTNEDRLTTVQVGDDDEIMEFSDFSTVPSDITSTEGDRESTVTERIGNTIFSKFEDLTREVGSTLSIEHILTTQPPTKPTKVEFADDKSNNLFESDDYQNDGKDLQVTTLGYEDDDYDITGRPANNEVYEKIVSEMEPEVRAEIFELISTGSSAKRLEEILSSRNMSIDELIALRQRGSSRVHLAELSRNRSGNLKNNEEVSESATEVPEDKVTDNAQKEPIIIDLFDSKVEDTKEQEVKEVLNLEDLLKAFDSLPFGRNLTIDGEIVEKVSTVTSTSTTESLKYEIRNTFKQHGDKIENSGFEEENLKIDKEIEISDKRSGKNIPLEVNHKDQLLEREIGTVEEVIRKLESLEAEATPELSNEDVEKKTLARVRPSIIASGAILGLTIVGFLIILIVCRIKQKQRYRYKNSFAKTVFQAPAMNGRKLSNSSSLNTIMVNVVATSTAKRTIQHETQEVEEHFDCKSDIDNDSLDANDSWDTIPDFMK